MSHPGGANSTVSLLGGDSLNRQSSREALDRHVALTYRANSAATQSGFAALTTASRKYRAAQAGSEKSDPASEPPAIETLTLPGH